MKNNMKNKRSFSDMKKGPKKTPSVKVSSAKQFENEEGEIKDLENRIEEEAPQPGTQPRR
jgi:hypothetical protein